MTARSTDSNFTTKALLTRDFEFRIPQIPAENTLGQAIGVAVRGPSDHILSQDLPLALARALEEGRIMGRASTLLLKNHCPRRARSGTPPMC
jgi:hypothetical protein